MALPGNLRRNDIARSCTRNEYDEAIASADAITARGD